MQGRASRPSDHESAHSGLSTLICFVSHRSRSSMKLSLILLFCTLLALLASLTPVSADLLSDLLNGAVGARQQGGGGGARGNSGGGGGHRGADTCDAFVCPLAGHTPAARAGWIPTSNGCGSYGFQMASAWHTPCCDVHDKCYSTCGMKREQCDTQFQQCMRQSCAKLLSTARSPRDRQVHADCEGQANLFHSATRSMGCQAFLDSQREACHCSLPQKIKNLVGDTAAAAMAGVQHVHATMKQIQDEL